MIPRFLRPIGNCVGWSVTFDSTARLTHHFIVGITNSAPSFTPLGQREVTVLVLV
jgi:hypothetical protein